MTHPNLITDASDALEFAFGGRARFTLVSRASGKRYTYKLSKAKDNDTMFFASILTRGSNDDDAAYDYIGFVRRDGDVATLIAGQKGNPHHPAYQALGWSISRLTAGAVPDQLEFWHEGRCARCAHPLTDPASIKRGFGPECVKHTH